MKILTFILTILILTSCKERIKIISIQKIEYQVDTIYNYTYVISHLDENIPTIGIMRNHEKYEVGQEINIY